MIRRCPVCETPSSQSWADLVLGPHDSGKVCPSCTTTTRFAPAPEPFPTTARYASRAFRADPSSLLWEDDEGQVREPTDAHRAHRARMRWLEIGDHLGGDLANARILEVGCRDGLTLSAARALTTGPIVGLEPWMPWRRRAEARGLLVHPDSLERWATTDTFDVVIDCDLLHHLPDPIAHLRALRARVAPGGVAMIEVPHLLGGGAALRDTLRPECTSAWTPRALATACRRAGLLPVSVYAAAEVRVCCEVAPPSELAITSGPDASAIVALAEGNERRRAVKQSLQSEYVDDETIRFAIASHRDSTRPEVRADLAIELATFFHGRSDFDAASSWLHASLSDRSDPDVLATVLQIDRVRNLLDTSARPSRWHHRIEHATQTRLAC